MTPEQFCYWLQGFAEITDGEPTPEQWKAIREHLATVFTKVTPAFEPLKQYAPNDGPRLPQGPMCSGNIC